MKLRYRELFKVSFATSYYVDGQAHNDVLLTPTLYCSRQMSRYKIISKKSSDGITLYYEASPLTNDATAFKTIKTEEKFVFRAMVNNPELWYYADVNGWQQDKVYFLKNTVYNTTGNISIHNGALSNPVLNRPLSFIHELPLQAEQSLLEIRNAADILVKSIVIRGRKTDESAGKTEGFPVDLVTQGDGLYTLRHIKKSGTTDQKAYCSSDCTPGTFAIVEITYKGNAAWTGVAPTQQFRINITTRPAEWVYEVYIRPKPTSTLLASKLFIKHEPAGAEPVQTFSVIVADDTAGFVRFKSDALLKFSQRPMKLRLVTPDLVTPKDVISVLPGPSAQTIVKSGPNLSARIIVNV